jgi:uncharacterized protein (TIGR02996 family)
MNMTHPARFIQHILACPDDDSPRLRYANWLDGCGNPLGEFIRLQCLLAQNPISEPHIYYERREQELLAKFRRNWSQALVGRVDWCSFRRGFVEEVSIVDRQLIKHAKELFRCAPVLDIHLKSDGGRLHALPELPGVHHTLFLDLSSQRLGDESIERLAEAPMLAHVHGLNLGSCWLGDEGLEYLFDSVYLGNVRELYLNDNPITDEAIRRFVMSPIVERLQVLDVRFTLISKEGISVLQRVLGDKVLFANSSTECTGGMPDRPPENRRLSQWMKPSN